MTFQILSIRNESKFYFSCGKRILDLALTIPALIALSPVIFVTAILVRIHLGSPVLFKQIRPGLHGKPFAIFKFRTMADARGNDGGLLPDAERLTRFGRFLRSTSLDELPELFNVLKGDMSIVGPRPLLMQYLNYYTSQQARRHEIKPGITGWAQVNGRNNVKFSERLKMDVWYVDNTTLLLDLKIIFLTVLYVLRHVGVRSDFESCLTEVDDCGFYEKSSETQKSKSKSAIK
jgi:lipopolysaccharide/colanic/teichoic acid biosynthesis glycosyltransferase